jgi:hypothetical protein
MSTKNPFQQTMTKLRVPDDMSPSIAIGGFDLQADDDRCIEVPKHLAAELRGHGLTDWVEPAAKTAAKK